MKWFRVYCEIKDDPRCLSCPTISSASGSTSWRWRPRPRRGASSRSYRPRGLAAALHTTPDELADALTLFAELGMTEHPENGGIVVSNFVDRQYDNPSDHPQNVDARKQKMKERQQNDNRTPQNETETSKNALERDTDTERETEAESERGGGARRGRAARRRAR